MGAGDGALVQFDQRIAVLAGRQRVQAGDGAGGVLAGLAGGVVQRAGGFHGGEDGVEVLDAALLDGLAHQRGLFRGAFAHGVDQRQGGFAFGQIVADVLAQGGGVAAVVEQVVDQLEGYP